MRSFVISLCSLMAVGAFVTVGAQDEPTLEVTRYTAECLARVVDGKCSEGQALEAEFGPRQQTID